MLITKSLPVMGAFCLAVSVPAQAWQQYTDLKKAGWSGDGLEDARLWAKEIGSAAVFIVANGHVVAAWGSVDHPFKAASVRKSLYDATIGAAHLAKEFDVQATLGAMRIDDIHPLTDREKEATFEQLMLSRSGVYHTAAYETSSNASRRPKRGAAKPGEKWYYNNWDFNVLVPAFHSLSGEVMQDAFAVRIAKAVGMTDFRPEHLFDSLEPRMSRHPATTFRISARDLARVGLLYLRAGKWGSKQIVAGSWVERSMHAHTVFEKEHYRGEGKGYGRLWWIFPARKDTLSAYESHHRIAARGTGGQIMVLLPELDMLIVHLADTDRGRGVGGRNGVQLMDKIMRARNGRPAADCAMGPLRIQPLGKKRPAPLPELKTVPAERRGELVGRFMFSERMGLRLYVHGERLFAQPLGLPVSNDVELFLAKDGTLRSPVASLVVTPVRGDGRVEALRMAFGGRTSTGQRKD